MTKTIPQVILEINNTIVDNTIGSITPAVMRQNLTDMLGGGIGAAISTFLRGDGTWALAGINLSQLVVTSSLAVPTTVQRVLVNASAPVTITLPTALSMSQEGFSFGVFIKDISGTANVNNITVNFTSPEKCDGLSSLVVNNPYGWLAVSPIPGGGAWYQSQ
jgi:hypothetical protein